MSAIGHASGIAVPRTSDSGVYATVAQDPYGMAQIGVEEAVRAVKHERVKRNVNTGNPLVTQQNAKA